MGDETSVEMTDFRFSGLQKCRITSSDKITSCFPSVAISSQAQVIVTCTGRTELTACPSNLIHDLRVNKENVNTEFQGLPKKTILIDNIEEITSIGVSCDGKILAALVNSSTGCFVYLFDIRVFFQSYSGPTAHFCSVRLGSDASARGVALEWNPTIADVFAASGSDKTVIVCSVSLEDPKIYKLLGIKQFPDVLTIISWSPKGKQLTAADTAGNIVQLKPELEVVRKTPVKEGLPITAASSSLTICGLCWLATTDWLVSFSEEGKSDTYTFLLKIMKNKPPQWILFPDLQYGNPSSKLPSRIFTASHLLVNWNLVLICNSKTSEITVVGKTGEDWKVWSLDDCDRFDLPTNAEMADTFPLGMALDISSSKTVILEDSATKTHRPSPILMVLNSDGVLASSHVILDLGVPDVQVKPDILSSEGVVIGNSQPSIASGEKFHSDKAKSLFAAAAATTPAPNTLFPKTPGPTAGVSSIFGGSSTPLSTATAPTTTTGFGSSGFGKSSALSSLLGEPPKTASTVSASTSIFGNAPAASTATIPVPSTPLFSKPTGSLFPQSTTTSVATPNPIAKPAPKPVVSPQKSLASADLTEHTKTLTDPVPVPVVRDNKAEIEQAKKSFMTVYKKMLEEMTGLKDDIGVVHTGLQKTKPIVDESEHDIEGQEVVLEMIKTNSQLEESMSALEKQLKEAFATAAEKSDIADMFQGDKSLLKRLKETDDFDREERMKRLVIHMDNLKEKYADAKKMLEHAKKQQVSKTAHLLPSAIGADDLIHKQVKAINKSMTALRFRLDTVEDDIKHVAQVAKKLDVKKQGKLNDKQILAVNILRVQPVPAPSGDLDEMRRKMAAIVQAKLKHPPKLRRIVALPFTNETQAQTSAPKALNISALHKEQVEKARPLTKPVVHMSDAATQADMVVQTTTPAVVKQPETPVSSSFSSSIATPSLISNINKPLISSTPLPKVLSETNTVNTGTPNVISINSVIGLDTKKDNTTQGSQSLNTNKPASAKSFSFGAPSGGLSLFGQASSQSVGTPTTTSLFSKKDTLEKPTEKVDLNSTSSIFGKSPLKDAIDAPSEESSKAETKSSTTVLPAESPKTDIPEKSETTETKTDVKKEDTPTSETAPTEQKSSVFGGNAAKSTSIFGGATSEPSKTSIFGTSSSTASTTPSIFGTSTSGASTTPSVFGTSTSTASTTPSVFGTSTSTASTTPSVFGTSTSTASATPSVFGTSTSTASSTPSVFGTSNAPSTKPSVFGASSTIAPATSSVFGTQSSAAAPAASSVFGAPTSASSKTPSVFGAAASAAPTTTSSVFGGSAAAAAPGPFGSFGKADSAQSTNASTFSFKNSQGSSTPAATNPSGFSFNKPNLGGGSNMGFAAAAAKAAQEGMMEDDMGDASGANKPSGFGSSFGSLSFGTSKPADSSKNVFGSVSQSANSTKEGWLFKKDANVSFGAQQSQQTNQSFGSFGSGQSGQSGSVFGGTQQSASNTSSSAFGGTPKFGGNPAFGAKPVFGGGSSPFGSSPAKGGSVFGGGASTGGGFAAFANASSGFGGGQQSAPGTSIFGGGSNQPAQQPTASVFGGSQNKNSFNTWR